MFWVNWTNDALPVCSLGFFAEFCGSGTLDAVLLEEDYVRILVKGRRLVGVSRGDVDRAKLEEMGRFVWTRVAGLSNSPVNFGRLPPSQEGYARRPRIRTLMVEVLQGPATIAVPEPGKFKLAEWPAGEGTPLMQEADRRVGVR